MNDNEKWKLECNNMLKGLVGEALIEKWWGSPNKSFNYQTPFVQFELDPHIVRDYLVWHSYCVGGG
jgi:hypothetical protein